MPCMVKPIVCKDHEIAHVNSVAITKADTVAPRSEPVGRQNRQIGAVHTTVEIEIGRIGQSRQSLEQTPHLGVVRPAAKSQVLPDIPVGANTPNQKGTQ